MNSEKTAVFLRKIPFLLILAATFICSIQSGAILWQHCIIPLLLLCSAVVFNKFKSSGIVTDILIFVSLISCIAAVISTKSDMQEAIHESLKYICFGAAFCASVSIPKKSVYTAVAVAGLFIAASGILSYCNIVRLPELVFNDRGILRLQSFIRYANTTAVFSGCTYFCLCGISISNRKLSGFLKMVLLCALYLTVSKAAIPIFLLIGILYMIKKQDSDFIVHNIVCFVFAIPAIYLSGQKMFTQCMLLIILWIAVGTLLSGRIKYSKKLSVICIGAAGIATAAAVILMISGKYDIFSTFTYRLKYMRDAIKLLPGGVFGNGPASWKVMQFGIQQEQYAVSYIHNGWLQFLVENGAVFFLSFVSVFAVTVYRMLKTRSYEGLAAVLFIAIHSFIDVNFGFALILIVSGLLCGCESKPSSSKTLPVAALVICLSSACYSTAEYFVRHRFESAYTSGYYRLALTNAYKLEKLCPYDSSVQLNILALNNEYTEERLQKAMELSPYDRNIVTKYAEFLISDKSKDVIKALEKLINMAPLQEDTYVTVRQLAGKAYTEGVITEEEYGEFITGTDSVMNSYGVKDRNRQLDDIYKSN